MATVDFNVQFAENQYNVQFEESSMELEAQFEPNGGGGGGAVNSVNGQTGDVVLDAGDLGYDDEETYTSGTVGKEISNLKGGLSDKLDAPSTAGTSGQVLTSDGEGGQYWHTPSGGGGGSVTIDPTLTIEGDGADAKATGDRIKEVVNNGYYSQGLADDYYTLTSGKVNNDTAHPISEAVSAATNCGYIIIQKNQIPEAIKFDTTKYKVNICFVNNNYIISNTYTSWITSSPVSYSTPASDWDSICLNVQKLSGNYTTSELSEALYKTVASTVGNLATKDYVDSVATKGRKIIYPDGFSSRIMPNIYYNGRYNADIDTDDYKMVGSGDVWVSLDGNDSTGNGSESNPYLTITKALTANAVNVHIKAGTYEQGTHYSTSCDFKNKNVYGHGTVILQNDTAGHYVIVNGGSAYVENITFKHGNATTNSTFIGLASASGQYVCCVGCTFRNGGENGLALNGTDAIMVNCKAHDNRRDGFNYHARTVSNITYIPNVIEIDCTGYDNGSSSSGNDSCNGTTSHDGTKIIRINGEYHSCYGGVVADIATANDEPTESVNYGVLSHDSTGTGTYNASFWASVNTKMYLYDCQCYGGTYDLSAVNDGTIVSRRLTTGRDVPSVNKANDATVLQY